MTYYILSPLMTENCCAQFSLMACKIRALERKKYAGTRPVLGPLIHYY